MLNRINDNALPDDIGVVDLATGETVTLYILNSTAIPLANYPVS